MQLTNKNDRFRRYLNRALLLFWIFALAALVCACNAPAYAVAEQPETLPPYPADWTANPTAGIVLEPVSEGAVQ